MNGLFRTVNIFFKAEFIGSVHKSVAKIE